METYKWAPCITGKSTNHLLPLYPNRKWFNVKDLHNEIEDIGQCNDLASVVTTVCQLCEIDPDTRISLQYISEAREAFKNEMKENIGLDPADWLTGKFFARLGLRKVDTVAQFLYETARVYSEIARLWSPILTTFTERIIDLCKTKGVTKLNIMARDANPIYVIVNRLKEKEQFDIDIELAELSRRVFQIHDEIAEEGKPSELASAVVMDGRELAVVKYLEKLFKGKSACVDVMCYGTVFKEFFAKGQIDPKPLPLLFISNNNEITGFINEVVGLAYWYGKEIPDEFLTILGDTVESFPKPYKNVEVTVNRHWEIELLAEPVDIVSTCCAFAIYWTLYHSDFQPSEPITELENLYRLHQAIIEEGREQIPALLPRSVPKWSKRDEFLTQWFKEPGPLPPKRQ